MARISFYRKESISHQYLFLGEGMFLSFINEILFLLQPPAFLKADFNQNKAWVLKNIALEEKTVK